MAEFVYLNGQILPSDEARIRVDDRGFMLADGIYEVIRAYRGQPFLLERRHVSGFFLGFPEQIGVAVIVDTATLAHLLAACRVG